MAILYLNGRPLVPGLFMTPDGEGPAPLSEGSIILPLTPEQATDLFEDIQTPTP